ncbi:MAG: cytochrome c [Rhodocyclaceae bacterium]|nr:cytochrome c [Rhodocyclaceae bacterium]
MPRTFFLVIFAALALSGCGEPEDTRPGQPVAHRKQAFKDIFDVFDSMGAMLKKDSYDAATFKALAQQLAARRNAPWNYFAADTLYPPSHARAEIWSEPAKFDEDKKDFLAATDRLIAAAGGQDRRAIEAAFGKVKDSCEACHKAFKKRSD